MIDKSLRDRLESILCAASFAFSICPWFMMAGCPLAISVLAVIPVFIGVLAMQEHSEKV